MTLYQVQRRICEILKEDEKLRAIGAGVAFADAGDAFAGVGEALKRTGLCVVVRTCEWRQESGAAKNAVGIGSLVVAVAEVPELNRALPGAACGQEVAEYIAWRLQLEPIEAGRSVLSLTGSLSTLFDEKGASAVTTMTFEFQHQLENTLETVK